WRGSFAALAVLNGLVAAILWLRLPAEPSTRSTRHRGTSERESVLHLLGNRRLVATFGVGFCLLFTLVAMFTYVTFHLAAPPFGLSTVALGWLFVVYL